MGPRRQISFVLVPSCVSILCDGGHAYRVKRRDLAMYPIVLQSFHEYLLSDAFQNDVLRILSDTCSALNWTVESLSLERPHMGKIHVKGYLRMNLENTAQSTVFPVWKTFSTHFSELLYVKSHHEEWTVHDVSVPFPDQDHDVESNHNVESNHEVLKEKTFRFHPFFSSTVSAPFSHLSFV